MRVAILGNSGSGKSTLAALLAAAAGAPHLDLDTVAWEPRQPAVPRDAADACADVRAFCRASERWIVEGCYTTLVEAALEFTPELIFLNPGVEVCVANCRARPWEPHKYASPQEQDDNLPFLLSWVADYYTRSGPLSLEAHVTCFRAYSGPKHEYHAAPDVHSLEFMRASRPAEAFPAGLSGPALRALANAGIRSLAQLAQHSESAVAALHGMGPKGMRLLKAALEAEGRRFRNG